jgi:hypothetical protein
MVGFTNTALRRSLLVEFNLYSRQRATISMKLFIRFYNYVYVYPVNQCVN